MYGTAKTKTVDLGSKGSFKEHPGALHRALGVPEGDPIPEDKLESARNSSNPHVAKMAEFAHTMAGWKH